MAKIEMSSADHWREATEDGGLRISGANSSRFSTGTASASLGVQPDIMQEHSKAISDAGLDRQKSLNLSRSTAKFFKEQALLTDYGWIIFLVEATRLVLGAVQVFVALRLFYTLVFEDDACAKYWAPQTVSWVTMGFWIFRHTIDRQSLDGSWWQRVVLRDQRFLVAMWQLSTNFIMLGLYVGMILLQVPVKDCEFELIKDDFAHVGLLATLMDLVSIWVFEAMLWLHLKLTYQFILPEENDIGMVVLDDTFEIKQKNCAMCNQAFRNKEELSRADGVKGCKHWFHRTCLQHYLVGETDCPVCYQELGTEEVNDKTVLLTHEEEA